MITKQVEKNNWQRWAIGIAVTVLLALAIDFGHSGSTIKKVQAEDHVKLEDLHDDFDEFKQTQKDNRDADNKRRDLMENDIKLILKELRK